MTGDLFIPDGLDPAEGLPRTTHLAIGAHQDDLEFFAVHGVLECFRRPDRWFAGVVCTDGRGSARTGVYADLSDDAMAAVRADEQRTAARIGGYGAVAQLGFSSAAVKGGDPAVTAALRSLLERARPEVLYLHAPTDKHDTHVATCLRALEAVRQLPKAQRPTHVLGCEVWRDLDWLPEALKVALPVSSRPHLQAALNGVFDSQIAGGKRYDLAVVGRRLANATFHDSHAVDAEERLTFALDLTATLDDAVPLAAAVRELCRSALEGLAADVTGRLERLA